MLKNTLSFHCLLNDELSKLTPTLDVIEFTCTNLFKIIQNNSATSKSNFYSNYATVNFERNSPTFRFSNQNVFCVFCLNDECLSKSESYISSIEYSSLLNKMFKANSNRVLKLKIIKLMAENEYFYDRKDKFEFSSFFCFIRMQQNKFLEIIDLIIQYKIYTVPLLRKEIIQDLFHDFQCNHLELKLILIPEFLSIIFQLKNRVIDDFFRKNSLIFLSIFFYFRSVNLLFHLLSKSDYVQLWEQKNEHLQDKMKLCLLKAFVRLNYIEPIMILMCKSKKIFLKYRYIIYSLFEMEYHLLVHKNSTSIVGYHFLQTIIYFVCKEYFEFWTLTRLSEFNLMSDISLFIQEYSCIFVNLLRILEKYLAYRPNLFNHKYIKNLKYLEHIIHTCRTKILKTVKNQRDESKESQIIQID